MIPPDASAAFVANMEDVLEVYQRPHDPQRPLVAASTPRHTAVGSGWRLSRQGFGWRQIGVVGIAVGEMSKWREEVVRALTPDGADDISGFARDGVGAFH